MRGAPDLREACRRSWAGCGPRHGKAREGPSGPGGESVRGAAAPRPGRDPAVIRAGAGAGLLRADAGHGAGSLAPQGPWARPATGPRVRVSHGFTFVPYPFSLTSQKRSELVTASLREHGSPPRHGSPCLQLPPSHVSVPRDTPQTSLTRPLRRSVPSKAHASTTR